MKRLVLCAGLLLSGIVLVACGGGGGGGSSPTDNSGQTDLSTFTSDTRVGSNSGAVTGQVLDAGNQPLSGVEVKIEVASTRQSTSFTVTTDAGGVFRIGNIPPGRYTITISSNGSQTTTFEIEILANAVTTAETVKLEAAVTGQHGRIIGTVQSTAGVRLQHAKVTATAGGTTHSAITSDNGEYKLADLPAGSYTLSCTKEGYTAATETVVVVAGSDHLYRFVLHTPTATAGKLSGVARDDLGHTLVSVTVVAMAGTSSVTATTNANGVYEFSGLSAGDYQLRAGKEGYASVELTKVTVHAGTTTTQNLTLPTATRYGTLSGKVTETNGHALAGAVVSATSGVVQLTVVTGSDGKFTILNVVPDSYTLTADKDGYHQATSGSQTVTVGATTTVNLQLAALSDAETKGSIAGLVRDSGGKGLNGAGVVAFQGATEVSATTDASGHYEVSGLPSGTYTVRARKDGYQDATASNVHVSAGETTTKDLTLTASTSPNGRLSGTVTDSNQNRHAGATVSITDGLHQYQINSTINGAYTIPDVVPGIYAATCSLNHYGTVVAENVSIAAGHTTTLDLILHPKPGSLAGVVRDSHGTAVAGATVALGTGSDQRSVQTNVAGHYEIPQLAGGNYTATASKTGYNPDSAAVTISIDARTDHDFVIQQTTGTILGTVTDVDTSAALAGVTVSATNGNVTRQTVTDDQGRYTLSGLTPGSYSMTATLTDYDDGTAANVIVTAANTTTRDFQLQSQGGGTGG